MLGAGQPLCSNRVERSFLLPDKRRFSPPMFLSYSPHLFSPAPPHPFSPSLYNFCAYNLRQIRTRGWIVSSDIVVTAAHLHSQLCIDISVDFLLIHQFFNGFLWVLWELFTFVHSFTYCRLLVCRLYSYWGTQTHPHKHSQITTCICSILFSH